MLTSEQFLKHLRDALNNLYEPHRLRESPLAALFGVAGRFDTPTALQRILIEAIESLEPGADEPAQSRAWEIYEPLFYRFVERLSQPEVADQLGLSPRHLRRKEHAALQALASVLWEQYRLEEVTPDANDGGQAPAPAMEESVVHKELAWLKEGAQAGPTSLNDVLPTLLDLARGLASQYGVALAVSIPAALPPVAADPVALRQCLLNLLGVVIPRAAGGQVNIAARTLRWEVELRVSCDAYPSGPKPSVGNETASLNIAQQLAELAGGRLSLAVDARAFDARLTLPAVEQLPVLVIDDNVDTLQLLQRYTAETRYRLITTRDPAQALSLAETLSPAIILLDVMMPRVDGWQVLGQLRQHPLTRHIPVIVCTILPQEEWARYLGASAFMRKPVTREALLAALDAQVALMESESD